MLKQFRDIWELTEAHVFPVDSTGLAFNLYADRHEELDLPDAPLRRRQNLFNYLAAYHDLPDAFVLAEAPGPWGCRFSGVPITSEEQLLDPTFPLTGRRTSRRVTPYAEYSARIYWRVLLPVFPRFLTWNSIPYHPHKPGMPLSIRTPTQREVAAQRDLIAQMIEVLDPCELIAVGRKAEYIYCLLGRTYTYVRHPSQGGAKIFEGQMRNLFGHALTSETGNLQ